MNILLVEDELKVADFIRKGLKEQLYDVTVAYDGLTGERLALENDYDVVVLDVILPQRNGLEVCKDLRRLKPELPVLLLTALGTMLDKMAGFDCGADDYLVKPFHFEELIARLKVLTRRKTMVTPGTIYRVADLEVDGYKKKVTRNKKEIQLTAKEFALLEVLVIHKNRVLSRVKIAEMVWGIDFNRGTNLIDVYINYLRSKIDKGFDQQLIHTVIGMGYTLKEP
jgi:DNA-binding response OmpR family regulator